MSATIHALIPDPEALLSLEPEELAGVVLEYLNSISYSDSGQLNRYNFSLPHTVEGYPPSYRGKISQALMEAWIWLEREGMIAPKPGTQNGWVFITRRGEKVQQAADLAAYRHADMLPKRLLHPIIAQKVWATFLRGDYDTAVFQAFKEVEVRVREVGGFDAQDIGTDLMRQAFHADNGPLIDHQMPPAERQALSALFAGAIGLYKNPHSHRNVQIDAVEAVEMITIASHLLKIADSRSSTPK